VTVNTSGALTSNWQPVHWNLDSYLCQCERSFSLVYGDVTGLVFLLLSRQRRHEFGIGTVDDGRMFISTVLGHQLLHTASSSYHVSRLCHSTRLVCCWCGQLRCTTWQHLMCQSVFILFEACVAFVWLIFHRGRSVSALPGLWASVLSYPCSVFVWHVRCPSGLNTAPVATSIDMAHR